MGGSASEEFLARRRERRGHLRTLARRLRGAMWRRCGQRRRSQRPYDDAPAAHVEDTPDTPTIETLVDLANAPVPARVAASGKPVTPLKNVVLMITEVDGARHPLIIGVPGDREVDMKRLAAQLGTRRSGAVQ